MKLSKELKAGLIAIFAIIAFVILYQFMKGKNLFTTDNVFFAKYDNVEGLSVSNPVSINGLKVGQVDEIKPITSKDGRLHFVVKLTVDNTFQFSNQSTVEIFEPGLMSGKEMRINLSYGGTVAKDGDTLKGNYQLSMLNSLSSQVKPVKDQLSGVLLKLDSTLASTNKIVDEQNRREIKLLLANLNKTIESFKATSDRTNAILASNENGLHEVVANANQTLLTANKTLDKYGSVAERVDINKLNGTIDQFNQTANKLNNVISGIQNGEGSLGKLMKDEELYNNLTKTSNNLNQLVEDVKANPKRYVNFSVFGKNSDKK
ncbi:MAG: MCE family protein [Chryseobacterium sp.]|uniref:Phospholipid/cholesterol/gamma-HCH transport system substrate-binding protein n=1 Tax=Epilithonimonas pallida TaxID=373671 RepID=A0ABY1QYN6_9FLAO|nr:MlaD family protein [Epilithonimonas pallida]MBN9337594.1 MCE family protein [Chryseobacterium sp.]OJX33025.1 MAG: mammalian cell entry protein [Chryseobacterium sp. 36-9]SMP89662.1 phospholipid/cholesterol/gamma-HCH transport system substrate-binding protein [Epilithonimonas pallida]